MHTSSRPTIVSSQNRASVQPASDPRRAAFAVIALSFLSALAACARPDYPSSSRIIAPEQSQESLDSKDTSGESQSSVLGGPASLDQQVRSSKKEPGTSKGTSKGVASGSLNSSNYSESLLEEREQLVAAEVLPAAAVAPEPLIGALYRSGRFLLWPPEREALELFKVEGAVDHAAFSTVTAKLAVSRKSAIVLYSLKTGLLLERLERLSANVTALTFDPGGRSLFIGGADGRVYRWNFTDTAPVSFRRGDTRLERYIGHGAVVGALAAHSEGRLFFSGDWSGRLNAWLPYDADAHRGRYGRNILGPRFFSDRGVRVRAERGEPESIDHLKLSADGQVLLLGLRSGFVEVWKVRGLTRLGRFAAHRGLIYALAWDETATTFATAGRDALIKVWDLTELTEAAEPAASITPRQSLMLAGVQQLLYLPELGWQAATAERGFFSVNDLAVAGQ